MIVLTRALKPFNLIFGFSPNKTDTFWFFLKPLIKKTPNSLSLSSIVRLTPYTVADLQVVIFSCQKFYEEVYLCCTISCHLDIKIVSLSTLMIALSAGIAAIWFSFTTDQQTRIFKGFCGVQWKSKKHSFPFFVNTCKLQNGRRCFQKAIKCNQSVDSNLAVAFPNMVK